MGTSFSGVRPRADFDVIDADIDKALTRATKKAGKDIDEGDVAAPLEDLEKGLDKSANIAGE
jgi:hypothetical protein